MQTGAEASQSLLQLVNRQAAALLDLVLCTKSTSAKHRSACLTASIGLIPVYSYGGQVAWAKLCMWTGLCRNMAGEGHLGEKHLSAADSSGRVSADAGLSCT